MTTSERAGHGVRTEARPRTWEELTEEPLRAALQACWILGEIAAVADEKLKPSEVVERMRGSSAEANDVPKTGGAR
jgi:hypothetical protein